MYWLTTLGKALASFHIIMCIAIHIDIRIHTYIATWTLYIDSTMMWHRGQDYM